MRSLSLGRKWSGSHIKSFYCRKQNQVMEDGCPQAMGPGGCPLRHNCPAHTEIAQEASNQAAIHSP